jgi:hypothetical protein
MRARPSQILDLTVCFAVNAWNGSVNFNCRLIVVSVGVANGTHERKVLRSRGRAEHNTYYGKSQDDHPA